MSKLNGSDPVQAAKNLQLQERVDSIAMCLDGEEIFVMPAQQAIDVGEVLVKYGHHLLTGLDEPARKTLSDQIRAKLNQRIYLVNKNLTERKVPPKRIAKELVDIVLREIL